MTPSFVTPTSQQCLVLSQMFIYRRKSQKMPTFVVYVFSTHSVVCNEPQDTDLGLDYEHQLQQQDSNDPTLSSYSSTFFSEQYRRPHRLQWIVRPPVATTTVSSDRGASILNMPSGGDKIVDDVHCVNGNCSVIAGSPFVRKSVI